MAHRVLATMLLATLSVLATNRVSAQFGQPSEKDKRTLQKALRKSMTAHEELVNDRVRRKRWSGWISTLVFLILAGLLAAAVSVGAFFFFRCPDCNKKWGLKLTDDWSWGNMDVKCQHCEYTRIKAEAEE